MNPQLVSPHRAPRRTLRVRSIVAASIAAALCDAFGAPSADVVVPYGTTAHKSRSELRAGDAAAGDRFGAAVDLDAGTLVVGAPGLDGGQGAAYVYVRNGDAFTFEAKLVASDAAAGDGFGASVAIFGDAIAVGAPARDDAAGDDQGGVYVFTRAAQVWTQATVLVPTAASAGDAFGGSVAIDGGTIVAGAPGRDTPRGDTGAAFVFVGAAASWVQQAVLAADDAAGGDQFGFSLAIDGDRAVAGAPRHDGANGTDGGAAFVFQRNGDAWTADGVLVAQEHGASALFGYAVDIEADTAAVGAPFEDRRERGAAYVFRRGLAEWTREARFRRDWYWGGATLGSSVRLHGDRMVAGAPSNSTTPYFSQYDGVVVTAQRQGSTWAALGELINHTGFSNQFLGLSAAIGSDVVVVGGVAPGTTTGRVWVFTTTPPSFTQVAQASPTSVRVLEEVEFSAAATDPDPSQFVSYAWSYGDGTSGRGGSSSHRYITPGTYTATVFAGDGLEASASSVEVQVAPVTGGASEVRLLEHYVHAPKRFREDGGGDGEGEDGGGGPTYYTEEVEDGTIDLRGKMDLSGVDLTGLVPETGFHLALGGFFLETNLAADRKWKPKRKRALLRIEEEVGDESSRIITIATVRLRWKNGVLRYRVRGTTVHNDVPYFGDAVVGDAYVGMETGTQIGSVSGAVAFAGATASIERSYTADVVSTVRTVHDAEEDYDYDLHTSEIRVVGKTPRTPR